MEPPACVAISEWVAPVVHVVGQLVELAQAPVRECRPLARAHAAGVMVELLCIAQEEVHGQEDQHEGRQHQVQQRPPSATQRAGISC